MTTTPPVTPEDEFAAAFAELNSPGGTPPVDEPPAETPPAETPPATEPPAEAPPAETPPVETPPAAEPPPAPAPAPAPAETEEQIRARIRAELEAEIKPPAPAPAPPADEPPKKVYTEEEESRLAKYHEDFPDIAASERLIRRSEYNDVINHVFAQLRPIIEEMQTKMSSYGKRTLYDDLVEMVPDYDDVRDKALTWIDTQPEYLKNAYKHVAENGTAEEVADLIGRYKRETNYQAAPARRPAATPPAAPAAPAAPAVPPAAAAAAASLAPVNSGRTEPPKPGPDMNDFDSAFAEFAKLKK